MLRRVAFRQVNALVDQLADNAERLQRMLDNADSTADERQRVWSRLSGSLKS